MGYQVEWKQEFLKEAEGLPLKRVIVTSSRASREGDAMVTRYGIEGTPIYFAGMTGEVTIDLKPDLTAEQVAKRLSGAKENLSLIRRSKKLLGLCPASQALLFHHLPRELLESGEIARFARAVKAFPLRLGAPQPLDEAISSSGGLELGELDDALMLRRHPGLFAAGEMLDWDVPTGGFLIQGCVATGFLAAQGILRFLGLDSEISHPA